MRAAPLPVVLLAAGVWLAGASGARAAEWTVAEVSGQAWITSPAAPATRAAAGAAVPEGATISTGGTGTATLEGANGSVLLGANTVLSPQGTSFWGRNLLVQRFGRIEVTTESRGFGSLAVQTPFLDAAAKTAQFAITVSAQDAAVEVMEGEVEVSDRHSRQVENLRQGDMRAAPLGRARAPAGAAGARPAAPADAENGRADGVGARREASPPAAEGPAGGRGPNR